MQNFPRAKATEAVAVMEAPPEPDGSGVNKRAFYVCNELGKDWVLLPPVTPAQINASRKIRWLISGNLDSPVQSIPRFPGKEGHYLKCLLARITAGAMCSPRGYYKAKGGNEYVGEDDDDMDDERPRKSLSIFQ